MKVAICLMFKDENDYLKEWLDYHRRIGIDHFFIYDNNSEIPVKSDSDITVYEWKNQSTSSQIDAYLHCCTHNDKYNYIAFIDTDEFICINGNIKTILSDFENKYESFNGLALYWRLYGNPNPYFEKRKSIDDYIFYQESIHIKSIVNPKSISGFHDPHFAKVKGLYIDENGKNITCALGTYSGKNMWIKHTWTRSLSEFIDKIKRGTGDHANRILNINNFYVYNDNCLLR